MRGASTSPDPLPGRDVQQDDAIFEPGLRQTSALLSPEQKQQLMQRIAQKLQAKRENSAVHLKTSGS